MHILGEDKETRTCTFCQWPHLTFKQCIYFPGWDRSKFAFIYKNAILTWELKEFAREWSVARFRREGKRVPTIWEREDKTYLLLTHPLSSPPGKGLWVSRFFTLTVLVFYSYWNKLLPSQQRGSLSYSYEIRNPKRVTRSWNRAGCVPPGVPEVRALFCPSPSASLTLTSSASPPSIW